MAGAADRYRTRAIPAMRSRSQNVPPDIEIAAVNGVYDALRVLVSGHRPLVCASIAFGHRRQSERASSSRAKRAGGNKAESF